MSTADAATTERQRQPLAFRLYVTAILGVALAFVPAGVAYVVHDPLEAVAWVLFISAASLLTVPMLPKVDVDAGLGAPVSVAAAVILGPPLALVVNLVSVAGERELSGATGPPPQELLRPAPLGRERFAEAVRLALRDLRRPDRLRGNALMGSALAAGLDGASPDRLVATLLAGIEQIGQEPRAGTLHRVLDRTFVRGAPTQEAAAEVLGLPLSTYRRHLARALERLTDLLWAVEIGQVRLGAGEHRSVTR